MLHALTGLFRRSAAPQLALDFDAQPPLRDADALLARLRTLGLRQVAGLVLTRNRRTMVSVVRGTLRVHEGYLAAPDPVHRAIVAFVMAGRRGAAVRREASRMIVAHAATFPYVTRERRREQPHPDDEALATRLAACHARLNAEHFDGALSAVRVRVSRRMRSRLGHYTPRRTGGEPEIAISRRHLRRHGFEEALHTLLHEMVHQWQDEQGLPVDHGRVFRQKARAVGALPSATRALR